MDQKVEITEATLHIPQVHIAPAILNTHKGRSNKWAEYLLRRPDIRSFNVPQGKLRVSKALIVTWQIRDEL